jgi:hypothetical protein
MAVVIKFALSKPKFCKTALLLATNNKILDGTAK